MTTTKFQNKYRIESARLKGYDYSRAGYYFITICTHNREHYFGEISKGRMILSEIGQIAHKYWNEIANHFENIELREFIIMPDHVHGIIQIKEAASKPVQTPNLGVSTVSISRAPKNWKAGSLGVIINQYKRICTIHARKIDPLFSWQSRYHDHIIRNKQEYHRISKYIENNPIKWEEDRLK